MSSVTLNKKLFLWLGLSLIFLLLFFKSLWQDIGSLFSLAYIQKKGAYPWAVCFYALCGFTSRFLQGQPAYKSTQAGSR